MIFQMAGFAGGKAAGSSGQVLCGEGQAGSEAGIFSVGAWQAESRAGQDLKRPKLQVQRLQRRASKDNQAGTGN